MSALPKPRRASPQTTQGFSPNHAGLLPKPRRASPQTTQGFSSNHAASRAPPPSSSRDTRSQYRESGGEEGRRVLVAGRRAADHGGVHHAPPAARSVGEPLAGPRG